MDIQHASCSTAEAEKMTKQTQQALAKARYLAAYTLATLKGVGK